MSELQNPTMDHVVKSNISELSDINYDVESVRNDFPILSRKIHDQDLVYFDNAATTQKPASVIQTLTRFYSEQNANVHRGIHTLSQEASDAFEAARGTIKKFINAASEQEVVFTTGTTGGINLVATALSRGILRPGDEIVISGMEHHSNIVPWQMACEYTGAILKVIDVLPDGTLDLEHYESLLTEKTRLVSIGHTSNAIGTIHPLKAIIDLAHSAEALVMVDGAQAVPHESVDVVALDADFFAFSSHKVYGPTGFGVLYGKKDLLEMLPPYQGGGDMIETVSFEKTTYNTLPFKFEAGTPNIAGAIAFAAAIDYLNEIGMDAVRKHEQGLIEYGLDALGSIPGMRIIGDGCPRASVISFLVGDIHPYDAGTFLDRMGIAVRTGHHCAMPLMNRFKIPGTIRASFGMYNTRSEIDALVKGVERVRGILA
ncbi:MAG: cysteine desulfurase [Rhodothermales bacterium]|nr:cysteine desulfurase [Rhodothermales bacterium]